MKIEIIGSVASGKTTLAKHLSEKLQIPYYQKDNIVWERTPDGDKKRSAKERDRLFEKIISGDDWIVEGSPRKCLKESFACCDYIMLLDVSMMLRLKRVFSRWFRQRMGREKYNSKPTFRFLLNNVKWVVEFNRDRVAIIKELSGYGDKFQVFYRPEDAMEFITNIVWRK